jgi:alanine-alpha-ketoisovalerate/valine-pyruvate aminotransferase
VKISEPKTDITKMFKCKKKEENYLDYLKTQGQMQVFRVVVKMMHNVYKIDIFVQNVFTEH